MEGVPVLGVCSDITGGTMLIVLRVVYNIFSKLYLRQSSVR